MVAPLAIIPIGIIKRSKLRIICQSLSSCLYQTFLAGCMQGAEINQHHLLARSGIYCVVPSRTPFRMDSEESEILEDEDPPSVLPASYVCQQAKESLGHNRSVNEQIGNDLA